MERKGESKLPKNARTQLSRGKTFGKMETDSKELSFFKIMTRNKVGQGKNGIKNKKKIAPPRKY